MRYLGKRDKRQFLLPYYIISVEKMISTYFYGRNRLNISCLVNMQETKLTLPKYNYMNPNKVRIFNGTLDVN